MTEVYQYNRPKALKIHKDERGYSDNSSKIDQDFRDRERFLTESKAYFDALGVNFELDDPILIFEAVEQILTDIEQTIKNKQERDREDESIRRARIKVRRYIDTNKGQHNHTDKFITLTFKEDIKDREDAVKYFKNFIQRMRYKFKDFKYIAVPELQDGKRTEDKEGRDVYHFHIIMFGIPYIKATDLIELWGHGYIDIQAMSQYHDLASYISKYVGKDMHTGRGKYQKRYFQTDLDLTTIMNRIEDLELESFKSYNDFIIETYGDTTKEFGVELNELVKRH